MADEQFLAASRCRREVPDEQGSMPMLATPVDFEGRAAAAALPGPAPR